MARRRAPIHERRERRMVGAYMDVPVADRFYDTCEAMGTNQSEILRALVGEWLKDHADVPVGDQEPLPGTTDQLAS